MLDPEYNTFVVHVVFSSFVIFLSFILFNTDVYLSCRFQIAGLIAKKAFTKVFAKYVKFADIFFLDLVFKLSKHTKINNHAMKLVNCPQPPYWPIYSLGPVELETLKAYIKINLANKFIRSFKSPVGTSIFFN